MTHTKEGFVPTDLVPTPLAGRVMTAICATCIVVPLALTIWIFMAAVAV